MYYVRTDQAVYFRYRWAHRSVGVYGEGSALKQVKPQFAYEHLPAACARAPMPEGQMRRLIAQQFHSYNQNDCALLDHISGKCAGAIIRNPTPRGFCSLLAWDTNNSPGPVAPRYRQDHRSLEYQVLSVLWSCKARHAVTSCRPGLEVKQFAACFTLPGHLRATSECRQQPLHPRLLDISFEMLGIIRPLPRSVARVAVFDG
jgi:HipA-like protein